MSTRNASSPAPAGADGDSDLPIVSGDGRYVVFASAAENLVSSGSSAPASGLAPRAFNVFVRDRVNGTTTLVSANLAGSGGNGDSFPAAISTNGQFVLFESAASDLVNGDTNNSTDVFLRDLAAGATELISAGTNGAPGNGGSRRPVMSPDARYIAFASAASNLAPQDTNGIADVFVRDRVAGTTAVASVGATSTRSYTFPSACESPEITPDGRFVAFYSTATNLVPGGIAPGQVYVRDLLNGATVWAGTNAPSLFRAVFGASNEVSCNHRISADGNYVVFEACPNPATNVASAGLILRYGMQTGLTDLISTNANVPLLHFEDLNTLDLTPDARYVAFVANTNGAFGSAKCLWLWDAQSGAASLLSQNLAGGVSANDDCNWPRLDASGRFAAFVAAASNLTATAVTGYNCYLRDTQAGTTQLLNADPNGLGSGAQSWTPPSISSDGHVVAFVCPDDHLVAADVNRANDVFVRDGILGATELISAHAPGLGSASGAGASGFSNLAISSNGLFVAFTSEAGDLVDKDTNQLRDVFVRDVANSANLLVSVNTNGFAASGISTEPALSADGRFVVFTSTAKDLIARDTNNALNVFIRDLHTGATTLVSRNTAGTGEGNGDSYTPSVSADGRFVLFYSAAQNLAPGTFNSGSVNLFLRDLQLGTNYALSAYSGAFTASMTPDGSRVSFVGSVDSLSPKLFVWDTALRKRIYTNAYTLLSTYNNISPDGRRVAYVDTQLKVANLASNTITIVSAGGFAPTLTSRFSNDGRFLAYTTSSTNSPADTNLTRDIYLYDFQSGSNSLVSRSFDSPTAAGGASDRPVLSPDGRFIAYRSFASNNVPTDVNGVPDLFLYDRSNSVTILLSVSLAGNQTANGRSLNPVFSGDSRSLVFASWASDLASNDFNAGSDIFLQSLASSSLVNTNADASVSGIQFWQIPDPGQNPAITWPAVPGTDYRVQFKDDLADPAWIDFGGSVTIVGGAGYAYDLPASGSRRFYRVIIGD